MWELGVYFCGLLKQSDIYDWKSQYDMSYNQNHDITKIKKHGLIYEKGLKEKKIFIWTKLILQNKVIKN